MVAEGVSDGTELFDDEDDEIIPATPEINLSPPLGEESPTLKEAPVSLKGSPIQMSLIKFV
ncbi:hypothetical protein PFISCL1PPCAC_4193 [Pristionchus fissidentatus]|uniref:Uncharacterized protein n=1 Tax=Pristionchus fissidentatus TaxID=1538716 RepID=A0AAV5V0P9_9BILA|nr:hypothetical protein PFISCL1PPCAC_4193 [Pristionchus fissidentatus]